MKWTEKQIRYIIQDMAEENPLACKALFTVSEIEFTENVPTMAVSLSSKPVLKINRAFCNNFLLTENDVKTVLLHEFLHVLMLHTEKYKISNPLLNIALDAIINAVIYRYKGMEYAGFFARYYKWEYLSFLLRPKTDDAVDVIKKSWMEIHEKIYAGKYCADDLYELLVYLQNKVRIKDLQNIKLLGNHTQENISDENKTLIEGIMNKMDGTMIWNKSQKRGSDDFLCKEENEIIKYKNYKWECTTLALLKECLVPDECKKNESSVDELILPVLSSSDRRAIVRFQFNGLLPFSKVEMTKYTASRLATIYLDVSGSMNEEIDRLISLLHLFRSYIKMPLHVFSNQVEDASFVKGKMVYNSTHGTSIGPVFDHMRKHRIRKSLIVTDGYVEKMDEKMLRGLQKNKIKVLVSAEGNPEQFSRLGLAYCQLKDIN